MKQAIVEASKEAARLIIMAIVPVILMGIDLEKQVVSINWFLVEFTALVTFLRFVDSLMHEIGKSRNSNLMKGGITRF